MSSSGPAAAAARCCASPSGPRASTHCSPASPSTSLSCAAAAPVTAAARWRHGTAARRLPPVGGCPVSVCSDTWYHSTITEDGRNIASNTDRLLPRTISCDEVLLLHIRQVRLGLRCITRLPVQTRICCVPGNHVQWEPTAHQPMLQMGTAPLHPTHHDHVGYVRTRKSPAMTNSLGVSRCTQWCSKSRSGDLADLQSNSSF